MTGLERTMEIGLLNNWWAICLYSGYFWEKSQLKSFTFTSLLFYMEESQNGFIEAIDSAN